MKAVNSKASVVEDVDHQSAVEFLKKVKLYRSNLMREDWDGVLKISRKDMETTLWILVKDSFNHALVKQLYMEVKGRGDDFIYQGRWYANKGKAEKEYLRKKRNLMEAGAYFRGEKTLEEISGTKF